MKNTVRKGNPNAGNPRKGILLVLSAVGLTLMCPAASERVETLLREMTLDI